MLRSTKTALRPFHRTIQINTVSTNRSHVTYSQTRSAVLEGVKRNIPKAVEQALQKPVSLPLLLARAPIGQDYTATVLPGTLTSILPILSPRGCPGGCPGGFGADSSQVDLPNQPNVVKDRASEADNSLCVCCIVASGASFDCKSLTKWPSATASS
ncbi:hypothetical protein DB88DRAFT_128205 [Papiliotrema laurentii]|uniref:Uncharacterized protein n=1 Tax=Papiliotrema laurentii TaxID=5418 RepID=A0AAD9CTV6_PAPLA|nr:hypothetical protein DB88DRAFT_128205 [Papiliotrema laurentii]